MPDYNSSNTSISLIDQARSNDAAAWQALCDIYSPLVYSWVRQAGLDGNDAEDIVQDVFRKVFGNLRSFHRDRQGDTFRGWLWTITRNEVRGWFRRQKAAVAKPQGGTEAQIQMASVADWVSDDSAIGEIQTDQNTETQMIRRAAEAIKNDFAEHTWQAFWRLTVEGHTAADIAADLDMTAVGVRQAKFRVLARLREYLG